MSGNGEILYDFLLKTLTTQFLVSMCNKNGDIHVKVMHYNNLIKKQPICYFFMISSLNTYPFVLTDMQDHTKKYEKMCAQTVYYCNYKSGWWFLIDIVDLIISELVVQHAQGLQIIFHPSNDQSFGYYC